MMDVHYTYCDKYFMMYVGMCVCVSAQSYLTLCNPMDYSPSSSSVRGTSQARIQEWVAISSSMGIFLTQGSNPCLLHGGRILHPWATGKAP